MDQRDLVIGTAGHIDHGKTALVRALTGVDTDRLPAEKQRGITIDLGFASLVFPNCQLAFVDVPGHERFIRNMLAGATGLDLAMLVVAADDSVMPQTREHLEILRLLGIPAGLIAITKCDLVDPSWIELVEGEVRSLVADSFLAHAAIVRTSSTTGAGLGTLRDAIGRLVSDAPLRFDSGLFRMAIDRAFTVPGHGTVVTGAVASGGISEGDEVDWLPAGRSVRVRGLQRHNRPVKSVSRGARVAINLAGVHHAEIRRGQVLATPGYLRPSRVLTVEARTAEFTPRPLRHRQRYRLHVGTAEVSATLVVLEDRVTSAGLGFLAQLHTAEPVAVVSGQPFVLREESPAATIGGGRVLDPTARRLRRRDAREMARAQRLRSDEPEIRSAASLSGFGIHPWSNLDLCRNAGVSLSEASASTASLTASGAIVQIPLGPRRATQILTEVAANLEERALRGLGRLHAARPRQSTVPRAHLLAELPDIANDALISSLIDRLAARGAVVADLRRVALKDFEPRLSQAERKLKAELAQALRSGGFSPPDAAELTAHSKGKSSVVAELLAILQDEDRAVAINPHLYLDFEHAAELRRLVAQRLQDGSAMTVAELRDLLQTTRKYAVPLGEYLDRIGLTIRDGDLRRLHPERRDDPS